MAKSESAHLDSLYKQIFDEIPIGLFIIGSDRCILAWNQWMEHNTEISARKAIGKTIQDLFPNFSNPRFDSALDMVLEHGYPQILSKILNNYIIPIPMNNTAYPELDIMQQHVELLPCCFQNNNMALVVIKDESEKTHLTNTLVSMASRFEQNSLMDTLTGLYNRRFLWKYLSQELKTAQREQYNVVCCLFDLDHFKEINDELGHDGGDEVLISFSNLSKSILRPNDCFIRYGGEEFIGIFSRISITNGLKLANRIRTKMNAIKKHGRINKVVTCSGGVSYWEPSKPKISAEKLVSRADVQLYKAKKMGRNCIVMDNKRS